jgi:hypothetical protein
LGFDAPERALDLATLTSRFERPDFAAGLKRAGIESIHALLSRELLPLGVLHASDLDGPFHTLRHPRLSDMAAHDFVIGNDATLPKFSAPESAEIGSQNSLLRRYADGEKGLLPAEVSEIAVREMVKLQLLSEAVTLLADWRRVDPGSKALNALLTELRNKPLVGSQIADRKLAAVGVLFGGRPLMNLEGPRSLVRAKRLSNLYLTHYHHAFPFDRGVLRGAWGNCSTKGCGKAQHQAEMQLGKIGAPKGREVPRRRSGASSPVPNEATDGADRSDSPASS